MVSVHCAGSLSVTAIGADALFGVVDGKVTLSGERTACGAIALAETESV
jgi:hypothetical protein